MAITADAVKQLRDTTGVPLMKCKEALAATNGDFDAAVDWLRKAGHAAASKRSGRETKAGTIGLAQAPGLAVAVKIGCETDFVGGNDLFKAFAAEVAAAALKAKTADVEAIKALKIGAQTVADALAGKIQQLGENMQIVDAALLTGSSVIGYNHGGRVVALVAGSGDAAALRSIALHVAAANPAPCALTRDAVPSALLSKEREIIAASDEIQKKPEAIRPKVIEGKLGRFYKENVLLEQEMLVDAEDQTVEQFAKAKGTTLSGFARLAI